MSPPFSESKSDPSESFACYMLQVGFLLGLFMDPEDGSDVFAQNFVLTFNGLDGIISQKTELFISIAVTS
jgi:hypothetical protein